MLNLSFRTGLQEEGVYELIYVHIVKIALKACERLKIRKISLYKAPYVHL
jgi:hypothetical protein